MGLTVGEATDLNHLLEWLLNLDSPMGLAGGTEACEAACRLADKANKTLLAGLNGTAVRRLWTAEAPRRARCKRRPAR